LSYFRQRFHHVPSARAPVSGKIGGSDRSQLKTVGRRDRRCSGDDIEIGAPFLRRRAKEIAQASQSKARAVAVTIAERGFDEKALLEFSGIIAKRAEIVAKSI
jgi:hypothetical protein